MLASLERNCIDISRYATAIHACSLAARKHDSTLHHDSPSTKHVGVEHQAELFRLQRPRISVLLPGYTPVLTELPMQLELHDQNLMTQDPIVTGTYGTCVESHSSMRETVHKLL